MPLHLAWLVVSLVFAANVARAQEPCPGLIIQGTVPEGPETHFFLPFEVPEDIAEIEVRHDDLSSENILDWGLDDPNGFRRWGGGKGDPAIVGLEAASPSYVPGPIPTGVWEVVVGKAKIVETPAEYDVCVILRTEPTLEPQPRMPYQDPGVLDEEARCASSGPDARRVVLAPPSRVLRVSRFSFDVAVRDAVANARRAPAPRAFAGAS